MGGAGPPVLPLMASLALVETLGIAKQERAQEFESGEGAQFKPTPAGQDILLLRKRRTGSLKVITSFFRLKLSEEPKKKVIRSADVYFPPKVK